MQCPDCKCQNPESAIFCNGCGCHLMGAEDNMAAMTVIGSERKHVTVMFCDMSGYTAMTESLDPEDVKEIMSQIFGKITQIIRKYDGFIERFIGDAVMAVFGVPKTHEDDPIRAIRAALEVHATVEKLSPQFEDRIGRPLSMHTGINTGLVVTGEVDIEKGKHGLTGDAINLASRLENIADAGEIIIGPDTYFQSLNFFKFEKLEPTIVKGKTEPINVYKVLGAADRPDKNRRMQGVQADLIGRDQEMEMLTGAAQRLKLGKGGIVCVVGEAGSGKSRLIREFKAKLDQDNIQWHEGHAYEYTKNFPYYPLMDMLTKAFQIDEEDSPATIITKIERVLADLSENNETIVPYIGSLFSIEYNGLEKTNPEDWKTKLQKAIAELFLSIGHRRPTIICFEDLQWADPSFIELLQYILLINTIPVLFICIYRPEITIDVGSDAASGPNRFSKIMVENLSSSELSEMVASMIGTHQVPIQLDHFIRTKIGGNPFYIEEFVNNLMESSVLRQNGGLWELTGDLAEYTIPLTVQGIIAARVDRLNKVTKRILQEASVIGSSFSVEILSKISIVKNEIEQHITDLVNLGLITIKNSLPQIEYSFRHVIIQEVVYNGLLIEERLSIHERVGNAIEKLFENRIAEFYEILAFHYQKSRSLSKAVKFLIKAGQKSIAKSAVGESHHYYQSAYDILSSNKCKTEEEERLLAELCIDWSPVFYFRSDFGGLIDLLKPFEENFIRLDDLSTLGMYYAWLGHAYGKREELKTSYSHLHKALKIGEQLNNRPIIAVACVGLVWTCADMGLIDEAIEYGNRAKAHAAELKNFFVYNILMTGLGLSYHFRGDVEKILEISTALLRDGLENNDIRMLSGAYITAGWAYITAGDFPLAIKQFKALINTPDPLRYYGGLLFLGYSYMADNQTEKAEQIHEEIKTYCETHGAEFIGRVSEGFQGLILMSSGKLREGLHIVENTLKAFNVSGSRYRYANYHYLIGRFYSKLVMRTEPLNLNFLIKNTWFLIRTLPMAAKKAHYHYNCAIEISGEIGAKCITGISLLDLGLLQKHKGRKQEARKSIALAKEYFEMCGAYAHLQRAQEAMTSL